MKRAIIIAKGEVQRVAYRDAVEKIARKLKITGFVENIKPYDIRIVAEGEDVSMDLFIQKISIKKFPIDVESLETHFDDFKGESEYFEIKRGDWQEELGERLDTAGTLLYRTVELSERNVELSEKSLKLGEESVTIGKKMLEKQDRTLEKQDRMLEKQDETIGVIRGLREDLKAYMEERFERIEQEIEGIKAKIGVF